MEPDLHVEVVRRLVAARFPEWAGLPVAALASSGTQNAVYRLGDGLCVRLPRQQWVAPRLEKEVRWLPLIAERSPLEVPTPVAVVPAGPGYPMPWAVYRWVEGEPYTALPVVDEGDAARRLAAFVAAVRSLDPAGAPRSQQDRPMVARDRGMRAALAVVGDVIDTERAAASWERSLGAPPPTGRPVWAHGDLLPPNLLVRGGALAAVIDFGCAGVGDPAVDLIAAWSAFGERGREVYRGALGVDEGTWRRGRGFALHQAVVIAAAHLRRPGPMLAVAARTAAAVLSDPEDRPCRLTGG